MKFAAQSLVIRLWAWDSICPRPYATRVDTVFSVLPSPSRTFTISLFLRLITTRTCSQILARTKKYLELAWFLLIDEPGVYISSLKSSEMKRLRTALTYTCIIAPLLSEHDQGLERISRSILLFVLASIYYMRALVYSPHDPCSIGFSRFSSEWCTFLWFVDRNGNRLHKRGR